MKRRTKNIYIIGNVAFVEDNCTRGSGRWIKTHPCVAMAACPYKECKAPLGEPCKSSFGFALGSTHQLRRKAAKRAIGNLTTTIIAHIAKP